MVCSPKISSLLSDKMLKTENKRLSETLNLVDIQNILPDSESITGMSVFALVSLFFIFMALIEYATILMAARLKESFNFNIKWNCETVDFVSMILYLLGIVVFLISYTSLYV